MHQLPSIPRGQSNYSHRATLDPGKNSKAVLAAVWTLDMLTASVHDAVQLLDSAARVDQLSECPVQNLKRTAAVIGFHLPLSVWAVADFNFC